MMLTQLQLENFKSWEDTGQIALKPITGFFGPNSSGKTSLFQALLMMKQTAESPDRGLALHFGNEKTLVALGDFESVIHRHETERNGSEDFARMEIQKGNSQYRMFMAMGP